MTDINRLYVVADVLITDYSSVFFDYANLHRPMLFYMYDLASYAGEIRGFYIDLDCLPGPIVETQADLHQALHAVEADKSRYAEKYAAFTPALIIWTTATPHSVWWSVWCLTETVQMWFNNKKIVF